MDQEQYTMLEQRLGRIHLRQRWGIETEYEAMIFGMGINFFHLENWYSIHSLIRNGLRLLGLYQRGLRNALDIQIRHNDIYLKDLPVPFDGYTILQVSDLHVDMNQTFRHALIERLRAVDYDLCVLTGDYRAKTYGSHEGAVRGMEQVRLHLKDPVYAVLGNHDTIRFVPPFEALGLRMLMNESVVVEKAGEAIYLAGIDDAHYYRVHNLEKAAHGVPLDAISILLSHTPETYRWAAHCDFKVMLCGHTHGGQICLPGGTPLIWDAQVPRDLVAGPWRYNNLIGYTSVGAGASIVDVRLNCPPEITLHHLRRV